MDSERELAAAKWLIEWIGWELPYGGVSQETIDQHTEAVRYIAAILAGTAREEDAPPSLKLSDEANDMVHDTLLGERERG